MKRICPARIRPYSSAIGSLTFMIMSAEAQTSSAVGRIVAPAATYSSFVMDDPTPASVSMTTSWPWTTSSRTPAGVMATRYSWFLISLGMPTFTMLRLPGCPVAGSMPAFPRS